MIHNLNLNRSTFILNLFFFYKTYFNKILEHEKHERKKEKSYRTSYFNKIIRQKMKELIKFWYTM